MVILGALKQIAGFVSPHHCFVNNCLFTLPWKDHMELTMLRQAARRGRLEALLHENSLRSTSTSGLSKILKPGNSSSQSAHVLSDIEIAHVHANGRRLDQQHYAMLLRYLNAIGKEYHSAYTTTPLVLGTPILPPSAQHPQEFKFENRTYSHNGSHDGNSHIQFYIPGAKDEIETGYIEAIWELPLQGIRQTFLLVRQHRPLSPAQLRKTPYAYEPCSKLQTKIVNLEPSIQVFIIEPQHIICHLTTYKNPPKTYGLNRETMVICWGLNRRRK
jgi:hypothetical protein